MGGENRSAIVVPEGITNVDGCCLRKAKRETKQTTQVKTPNLKYVLLVFMILEI